MSQTVADLRALEQRIAQLSPEQRIRLEELANEGLRRRFTPLPGAQTMAYESLADVLLYGGSAGGGKSGLLIGTAVTRHHRSLIFRRESTELDGLIAESRQLLGGEKGASYNGKDLEWTYDGGKSLRFGGMKEAEDWRKYAGRPRDLMGFDEAAEFLEVQVASVIAWLRSTIKDQRKRVILATNPPRSTDGAWIVKWFAPWLDPNFSNPAKPGELRWAIYVDNQMEWVEGPGEYRRKGEAYSARSYTFIPAKLEDNPFLSDTDYKSTLQNLPPVLREQLLKGNFFAGRADHDWQVIPTEWVRLAQARWKPDGAAGLMMTTISCDVAQGGSDLTTLSPRYGTWFANLITKPGADTPDAPSVAGLISINRRHGAGVVVDIGGGYGGGVVSFLKENNIDSVGFNGSHKSVRKTRDGLLGFVNKRAEAMWLFREALDPGQEGGSPIALPPDQVLADDLTSPRWVLRTNGIQVESKDDIRKRLGRSTDRGDAVVMCWSEGEILAVRKMKSLSHGRTPVVNRGYATMKRR